MKKSCSHSTQNRARLQWGKIRIFSPSPAPAGKFQGQIQEISVPSTAELPPAFEYPWWPSQLPAPKISLLGSALHSFSLVPDSGFISFIWSWFFSWEERGNNCLGATHDFVDLYHNCIIPAPSLGYFWCLCVFTEPTSMWILLWNFFHWHSQGVYICLGG